MTKETCERTKIEKKAIHFLDTPIVECDFMDSQINSMDKELSWDGYIYTYNSKKFSHRTLDDKIPIQVKGHWDKDKKEINKKKIQFPITLEVLENYYSDRGVLYFKIVLTDTKKAIFYSILYPSKIKGYLDEAARKKNKRQINVTLTKIEPKSEEILRICRQFTLESRKQGSGKGQIVPQSVCINDMTKYKTIKATAVDTYTPFELAQRLSVGDVCFYVQKDNSDIWFPVTDLQNIECFVKELRKQDVSIDGEIFYKAYEYIYGTSDTYSTQLSPNLIINWTKGTFEFHKSSSLDILYNDAVFLKKMENSASIEIGGKTIKYEGFKLHGRVSDDINLIIDFHDICEMAGMSVNTSWKNFSEDDFKAVLEVVRILHGKYEIENGNLYKHELKIGSKVYPFIISRDEDGKIQFTNRIYESKYQGYVKNGEKYYKVPMFCDLTSDIFGHLYKFDYADLRHQVENTDYVLETLEALNYAVIALISAYDECKEEELLNIAMYILTKMYQVDNSLIYARMNEWQIKKRKGTLSDIDKDEIEKILAMNSDNYQILCGLCALLDKKEEAYEYLNKISESEKKEFLTFPICRLFL